MFKVAICMLLALCLVRGIAWEKDYDASLEKAPAEANDEKEKPKPLTRDETMEISGAVRNGTGGAVIDKYYNSLLITDTRMALDTVQYWLNADAGYGKRILRDIGRTSPRTYWTVAASALSHPDVEVRNEAAVALELIADPRAWKVLQKRWRDEKDLSVKCNLIRAIASVGRADKRITNVIIRRFAFYPPGDAVKKG